MVPFYQNKVIINEFLFTRYLKNDVCEYMHISVTDFSSKNHQIPMELEILVVVTDPFWVVGTELRSSARAVCFNC